MTPGIQADPDTESAQVAGGSVVRTTRSEMTFVIRCRCRLSRPRRREWPRTGRPTPAGPDVAAVAEQPQRRPRPRRLPCTPPPTSSAWSPKSTPQATIDPSTRSPYSCTTANIRGASSATMPASKAANSGSSHSGGRREGSTTNRSSGWSGTCRSVPCRSVDAIMWQQPGRRGRPVGGAAPQGGRAGWWQDYGDILSSVAAYPGPTSIAIWNYGCAARNGSPKGSGDRDRR